MKKKCAIRLSLALSLWTITTLLCAGCASVRSTQQASGDFYKRSAKKMGVKFNGTEDTTLIKASMGWLGVPYRYGGQSHDGVDCSGFVHSVYSEAYGFTLPRTTAAMAKQVQRIRRSNLLFGDLVFFSVKDRRVSHVGIYMGEGKFVHASSSRGVSVASLDDDYWSKYYSGAGRVAAVKSPMGNEKVANKKSPKGKRFALRTSAQKNAKASSSISAPSTDSVIVVFDEEF